MNAGRTLVILVLAAVVIAGCGSAAPTQAPGAFELPMPTGTPAEAPAAFGAPVSDAVSESGAAATAAPAATQAPAEAGAPGQLAFAPSANVSMVIKDAELEVLVTDTDLAIRQVTQMAADHQGYIISSQVWYDAGNQFASLRLGIPSVHFEKVLNSLRGLGLRVLRENASGQDVSAEYVDLQSRLTNLEATAARVREFLADAKTVEESLRISGQLSELEQQIEQVKGQMRYYEGRSAFSTVTVYLTPEFPTPTPTMTTTPTATPTATAPWQPGETFNEASGVLKGFSRATVDTLIWVFVLAGPPILVVVLLAALVRWVLRKGS